MRKARLRRTQQGQAMLEFALMAIALLVLVFAVIDLARAGFMQHDLDGGASDLVSSLATLSGTNSSGNANTPNGGTPLDPSNADTAAQIQAAFAHAAQIANYNFSASPPLTATGPLTLTGSTLTNGQVTVAATPTLSAPTEITVTVTAPFTPVVGFYLHNAVLYLQARASVRTPAGQLGQ